MCPDFLVDYKTVQQRITDIDPVAYVRTRNYLQGSVSYLSPFLTHGVISTATVAHSILKNHSASSAEKLLTELAWREYFHRVWQFSGDDIYRDIKHSQERVEAEQLPSAVVSATTGIEAVDSAVTALTKRGYMHNHARMWLAALVCNVGRTHWYQPARWLYYHLLDGDLASNSLSWQWIAGTFSHRKYIANQDNLNRYSATLQKNTFLDVAYDDLQTLAIPDVLQARTPLALANAFPQSTTEPVSDSRDPVFLYSIWNLDPTWHQGREGTRILWIDPDMHDEFALSPLRWQFINHWAKAIDGLEIFLGDRSALFPSGTDHLTIYTREYPATVHWPGTRDERDWCYAQTVDSLKSFSNYWKRARKTSRFFNP